jgi:hypothetical protein
MKYTTINVTKLLIQKLKGKESYSTSSKVQLDCSKYSASVNRDYTINLDKSIVITLKKKDS